jgi:serine/threonine protein phosphatase PrpC
MPPNRNGWRAFGQSVRGATHMRENRPNQDALALANTMRGDGAAIAVADGHGDPIHFRSQRGSTLAVQSAMQVLENLSPEEVNNSPQRIVEKWRAAVAKDLQEHPYSEEENPSGPYVPYGTTLLAALACNDWVLYLQLGDGDILAVDEQGRTERPLAPDPRLDGVRTTSLCQNDAARLTRLRLVHHRPALIALATDGYANSYADDDAFVQIGPDYLKLIRQDPAALEQRLESILNHVSREGSSDDITLGLMVRNGETSKPAKRPRKKWMVAALAALLLVLFAAAAGWWLWRPVPPPPAPPAPKASPLFASV